MKNKILSLSQFQTRISDVIFSAELTSRTPHGPGSKGIIMQNTYKGQRAGALLDTETPQGYNVKLVEHSIAIF